MYTPMSRSIHYGKKNNSSSSPGNTFLKSTPVSEYKYLTSSSSFQMHSIYFSQQSSIKCVPASHHTTVTEPDCMFKILLHCFEISQFPEQLTASYNLQEQIFKVQPHSRNEIIISQSPYTERPAVPLQPDIELTCAMISLYLPFMGWLFYFKHNVLDLATT